MKGRKELASIGDLLDGVIAGIGGGSMSPMLVVRQVWHEVAGEEWADRARPVRCDGVTVVVEVADGAAASMFRYETRRIGRALAGPLGVVDALRVTIRVARTRAPSGPRE
jgi:hypothetical protein